MASSANHISPVSSCSDREETSGTFSEDPALQGGLAATVPYLGGEREDSSQRTIDYPDWLSYYFQDPDSDTEVPAAQPSPESEGPVLVTPIVVPTFEDSQFVEHDLREYFWQPDPEMAGFWAPAGWNPYFAQCSSSNSLQVCSCENNLQVSWRCELCHEWRCQRCTWLCLPQGDWSARHIWVCATCQVWIPMLSAWQQSQIYRHLMEVTAVRGPWRRA